MGKSSRNITVREGGAPYTGADISPQLGEKTMPEPASIADLGGPTWEQVDIS